MMSTNSLIVRKVDTVFEGVYCHSKGKPRHNGRVLAEHYTEPEKVKRLIAGGNMSWLGQETGDASTFNPPRNLPFADESYRQPDYDICSFYTRDWRQQGEDAETWPTLDAAVAQMYRGVEWLYVYDDGRWLCAPVLVLASNEPSELGEMLTVAEWVERNEQRVAEWFAANKERR
jgi:hypothetical protein